MQTAKRLFILLALSSMLAIAVDIHPAAAQGVGGIVSPILTNPCSTTDYDDLAAKTLGITASQLRVALVSGNTLQDVANNQNVALETVVAALEAAHRTDYEQAVKDGLYPTSTAFAAPLPRQPFTQPNGPSILPTPVVPGFPNLTIYPFVTLNPPYYGLDLHNTVKPLLIAAQSLDLQCPNLVELLRQGKSVALLAYSKNVKIQVLVDALMKAYLDARAADVKEGLIGQAEADGQNARLIERVLQMLSASGPAALVQFGLPPVPYAFAGTGRAQLQSNTGGVTLPDTPVTIMPPSAVVPDMATPSAPAVATAVATLSK